MTLENENKLLKRLLPVELIEGELLHDKIIMHNNVQIGKILINKEYAYALVKFLDKNFKKNEIVIGAKSKFRILIPEWLNI